jgi:hypothetical protein
LVLKGTSPNEKRSPQPGAAQLWLGGLETMEDGEKKNNNKGDKIKCAGAAKGIEGVLQTWMT